jgi:hypothetical protein
MATRASDTPPPSPISMPEGDREHADPALGLPRKDDETLKMDSLRDLFPHLSDQALETHRHTCERYRDEAYMRSQGHAGFATQDQESLGRHE